MRATAAARSARSCVLRIPMRGYEVRMVYADVMAMIVTNPHAGL